MALITSIPNKASVTYNGTPIESNEVVTILLLPPTLLKVADKLVASIGDVITYTITITNVGLNALTSLPFSDIIPAGAEYVADSFEVDGTPTSPTITDNTLTYTIPNIAALGTAVLSFQVDVIGGDDEN